MKWVIRPHQCQDQVVPFEMYRAHLQLANNCKVKENATWLPRLGYKIITLNTFTAPFNLLFKNE